MKTLSEDILARIPEPTVAEVIPRYVARYLDLMGLSATEPAKVIAENGILRDKPGFEIDFISRASLDSAEIEFENNVVLMPVRGHWKLEWAGGTATLNPGDTCLLPEGFKHKLAPSMTGEASLYRIISNDDPAGPTWTLL